MLEQLIESRSHLKENRNRTGFFLITSALVLMLGLSFLVWSMFAMNLNLTDDGLELSSLIAPVMIPAAEPPKPEPEPQREQSQPAKNEIATRNALIERVDENTIIPDKVSVTPSTQRQRPKDGIVKITEGPERDGTLLAGPARAGTDCCGGSNGTVGFGMVARNEKNDGEPPVMKKKEPEERRSTAPRSGGVLNGQAKYLPKPAYPQAARAVNVAGNVDVQVLIDESGNVVSAKAVSGPAMLRAAAEQAARSAKFGPTYLTGKPVKVTGIIIYRFSNG